MQPCVWPLQAGGRRAGASARRLVATPAREAVRGVLGGARLAALAALVAVALDLARELVLAAG